MPRRRRPPLLALLAALLALPLARHCAAQPCPTSGSVFQSVALTPKGYRLDFTLSVRLNASWNAAACFRHWHRVVCSWPRTWCDGRSTTFAVVDVQNFTARGGAYSNATQLMLNRTLYRPSWRDWELCLQNRPLWAECRMVLRYNATQPNVTAGVLFAANETVSRQLTARSTPFVAQPEYPPGQRAHAYGRLRHCASAPGDFNASSGVPTGVTCAHNDAPGFASRTNASSVVLLTQLLYDGDSVAVASSLTSLANATPGGRAVYGGGVLAAAAASMPRYTFLRNLWVGRYLLLTELDAATGAVVNRVFTPLGWELPAPPWGPNPAVTRVPRRNLFTNASFTLLLPADLLTTPAWPAAWGWPVANLSARMNFTVVPGSLAVVRSSAPAGSFNFTLTAGATLRASSITGFAKFPDLFTLSLLVNSSGLTGSTAPGLLPPQNWLTANMASRPMLAQQKRVTLKLLVLPCRACAWGTRAAGAAGCVQGVADTACTPCDACAAGQWESSPCAPDSATSVPGCSACTAACPAGQFLGAPCSRYADAQCVACSAACPGGTYAAGGCDGGAADTHCAPCAECGCSAAGSTGCAAGSGPGSTGAGCVCACRPGFAGVRCDECANASLVGGGCDQPCRCHAAGGACGANGTCACAAGWGGRYCDTCVRGRFGPACAGVCACGAHGLCADGAAGDGACACAPGWSGSTCQTPVEQGGGGGGGAAAPATAVVAGAPLPRLAATEGVPFSLPLPGDVFTRLPPGAPGAWVLALEPGAPPWLALVWDAGSPSNYTLAGTPARAHVTRGSRWLPAASASAVLTASLLAGPADPAAAAAAAGRMALALDVDAANAHPTLGAVPVGAAVATAAVGARWALRVVFGLPPSSNGSDAADGAGAVLRYHDADAAGGFNESLTLSLEGAPPWLTLAPEAAVLPAALAAGPAGAGSVRAAQPDYALGGTVPASAAASDVAFNLTLTDRLGARASVALGFHVNASATHGVLAFALAAGTGGAGGAVLAAVAPTTTGGGSGSGSGGGVPWAWVMPDSAFRVGPAPGAPSAVAVPPVVSYAVAALGGGGCGWLVAALARFAPSPAQLAVAAPSTWASAHLPRPVLAGTPPAVDPGAPSHLECAVALNATNAAGFTAGGVVTVALRAAPLGAAARPGVALLPVVRAVNEYVAAPLDVSALVAFNVSAGAVLSVNDSATGRPPPPSLLSLSCGGGGSTRVNATAAGSAGAASSKRITLRDADAAGCELASGVPPPPPGAAGAGAAAAYSHYAANDTAVPPGLYRVDVTLTALDGAPAARATARVPLTLTLLPATAFRAAATDWSPCSAPCGGGTRGRTWSCADPTGRRVHERNCRGAHAFPPAAVAPGSGGGGGVVETAACNSHACTGAPYFAVGPWGACSAACSPSGGGLPSQARWVACWDPDAAPPAAVADGGCAGAKPAARRACNAQPCPGASAAPAAPRFTGANCTHGLLDRLGRCCGGPHRLAASGVCCLPSGGPAVGGGDAVPPPDGGDGSAPVPVDDCGVCGGGDNCTLALTLTLPSAGVGAAACARRNASAGGTALPPGAAGGGGGGPLLAALQVGALTGPLAALTAGLRAALAVPTAVPLSVPQVTCLSAAAEPGGPPGRFRAALRLLIGPGSGLSTAQVLLALTTGDVAVAGEPAGGVLPAGAIAVSPGGGGGVGGALGHAAHPAAAVVLPAGVRNGSEALLLGAGVSSQHYRVGACGNGACELAEACVDELCSNAGACPADCGRAVLARLCPVPGAGYGVAAEHSGVPCGGPGRGACLVATGACSCAPGFAGAACQLAVAS
jgi:hypothetical protein